MLLSLQEQGVGFPALNRSKASYHRASKKHVPSNMQRW